MVVFKCLRPFFIKTFHNLTRNMSKFSVRCVDSEASLQISFEYAHTGCEGRVFNASRLKTEEVGTTLYRISQNINKHVNKTAKKRKRTEETPDPAVTMKVFESDAITQISDNVPLVDALKHDHVVLIEVEKFLVDLNPPSCSKVTIPQTAMVGFPIFPKLETEFCNTNESEFLWEKVKYSDADDTSKAQKPPPLEAVERCKVGNELVFSPSNEDLGYRLLLTCTPKHGNRSGRPMTVESKYDVTAGPGFCPFENRHLYTQRETEKGE